MIIRTTRTDILGASDISDRGINHFPAVTGTSQQNNAISISPLKTFEIIIFPFHLLRDNNHRHILMVDAILLVPAEGVTED